MGKSQKLVLKAEMYLEGQKFKENRKIIKTEYEGIQKNFSIHFITVLHILSFSDLQGTFRPLKQLSATSPSRFAFLVV